MLSYKGFLNSLKVNKHIGSVFGSGHALFHSAEGRDIIPWQKARNNQKKTKDLFVSTVVQQSNINGAGYGRFADEFIPKNKEILRKRIICLNTCTYSELFADDNVIKLSNIDELKELLVIYWKETLDVSKQEILQGFSDFIASHDDRFCHINTISLCVNHPPEDCNANISTAYNDDEGCLIGTTTESIKIGQELYQDYNEFTLPKFYIDFCNKVKLKDVSSFLEDINGVKDDVSTVFLTDINGVCGFKEEKYQVL